MIRDFPKPPAGHPDLSIKRRYFALHNPFGGHGHAKPAAAPAHH